MGILTIETLIVKIIEKMSKTKEVSFIFEYVYPYIYISLIMNSSVSFIPLIFLFYFSGYNDDSYYSYGMTLYLMIIL